MFFINILNFLSSSLFFRRLSIIVPVLYMGLILAGASIPAETGAAEKKHFLHFLLLPSFLQNVVHIPAYGLLSFFWRWYLNAFAQNKTPIVLALFLTIGFALFQEWYQTFIPGRYGSIGDVIVGVLGALLGVWVFSVLKRRLAWLAS